jgi:hypothetical protein
VTRIVSQWLSDHFGRQFYRGEPHRLRRQYRSASSHGGNSHEVSRDAPYCSRDFKPHLDSRPSQSRCGRVQKPDHYPLRCVWNRSFDDEGLGFSALVEIAGKRILFDTGNDADIFAANERAKGVDLKALDFVVLSHRHSDHMAGLNYVLSVNPTVKI